ncbi:MAG TPA: hypothetical protein DDY13_04235 [Cytophagales bacterium]|jgi:hypothetical protein|nr:hypothetical protein [Cytophagales bacterium]
MNNQKFFTVLIVLIMNLGPFFAFGQDNLPRLMYPNDQFTNSTNDTLFILSYGDFRKTLIKLNEAEVNQLRVDLLKQKVQALEDKTFLADSICQLRKMESDFWKMKLDETDKLLEASSKEKVELQYENERIRRSRVYYMTGGLIGGILITTLLVIGTN